MANRIPSFDEYYDLVDNYLDSNDFTITVNDEERERLINKYFDNNASRQKAEIRAGLKKLDEMIENACKERAEITKFTGGLINNYVW